MARFHEPTPELVAGWNTWVAGRPDNIRAVAERFDPWSLYRLQTSGHRVTIYSFSEDDAGKVWLTVNVTGKFNQVAFDRQVFGIDPDDLSPCELPTADEPLGAALTEREDVDAFIDAIRPTVLAELDKRKGSQ